MELAQAFRETDLDSNAWPWTPQTFWAPGSSFRVTADHERQLGDHISGLPKVVMDYASTQKAIINTAPFNSKESWFEWKVIWFPGFTFKSAQQGIRYMQ